MASPLRIGVLGCALGRARFGPALRLCPSLQVVALAEADRRLARSWARELGNNPKIFPDPATLLNADVACDAILMALPIAERFAWVKAILQAGKAVLCDLPFASSLAEYAELRRLSQTHQALLMPLLPRRLDPAFLQTREEIAAERVGTIRQIRCEWRFAANGAMAQEIAGTLGGEGWSVLVQTALCQTADLCRHWLGEPLTISADMDVVLPGTLARVADATNRRDEGLATVLITHENGQSVHRFARVRSVLPDERYILTGTRGHLELITAAAKAETVPSLLWSAPGQSPVPLPLPTPPYTADSPQTVRLVLQFAHFAECLQTGTPCPLNAQTAYAAFEMAQAAYLASVEGTKITLPLHP